MNVIGKALPGGVTEYRMPGWTFHFGPSVGNPGTTFVWSRNPRGWEDMDWVSTRANAIAWFEVRLRRYAELFG